MGRGFGSSAADSADGWIVMYHRQDHGAESAGRHCYWPPQDIGRDAVSFDDDP